MNNRPTDNTTVILMEPESLVQALPNRIAERVFDFERDAEEILRIGRDAAHRAATADREPDYIGGVFDMGEPPAYEPGPLTGAYGTTSGCDDFSCCEG